MAAQATRDFGVRAAYIVGMRESCALIFRSRRRRSPVREASHKVRPAASARMSPGASTTGDVIADRPGGTVRPVRYLRRVRPAVRIRSVRPVRRVLPDRPVLTALRSLIAAIGLLLLAPLPCAHAAPPVALHAAVGDTLDAREAARFGLFLDVAGFQRAVFAPAPWGGFLARIWADDMLDGWRERNVPSADWHAWRQRVEAILEGKMPPPAPGPAPAPMMATPPPPPAGAPLDILAQTAARVASSDSARPPLEPPLDQPPVEAPPVDPPPVEAPPAEPPLEPPPLDQPPVEAPPVETPPAEPTPADPPPAVSTRPAGRPLVWPEAPLPPRLARQPAPAGAEGDTSAGAHRTAAAVPYPPLPGRWLFGLGAGYRHVLTEYGDFFTDMGMFELSVQRPVSTRLTPYFAFQIGFGDIANDFEAVTADGHSAVYALESGVLLRAPSGMRSALYGGLAGGYYMRSLRWGGEAIPIYYDYPGYGTIVYELKNWGWAAKLGWQRQLRTDGGKPRLVDIQLRYEVYGDNELYFDQERMFYASGRDRWIALSITLLSGL